MDDDIMRLVRERNRKCEEKEFRRWRKWLLSLPHDLHLQPKNNFRVDVELQPLRWMRLGIVLLQSRKDVGYVQLKGGVQGPPIKSYLPYPVFQMAAEIFLKGMWLCKFPDCRRLNDRLYVDCRRRAEIFRQLGSERLGHDLVKIIDEIQRIPKYSKDAASVRFLALVDRIVRYYYWPLSQGAKRNVWAANRYPIRFYDDEAGQSRATFMESFPPAGWIEKLFKKMEQRAIRLWQLYLHLPKRWQQ